MQRVNEVGAENLRKFLKLSDVSCKKLSKSQQRPIRTETNQLQELVRYLPVEVLLM